MKRILTWTAVVVAAGCSLAVGGFWNLSSHRAGEEPIALTKPLAQFPPYYINCPPVHTAAAADVDDQQTVIGVTAGGKHRAYMVRSHVFRALPFVQGVPPSGSTESCERSRIIWQT
jgi:hypothetical protein